MAHHPQAVWALCAFGLALGLAAGCDVNPKTEDPSARGSSAPPGAGGAITLGGATGAGGPPFVVIPGGPADMGGTPPAGAGGSTPVGEERGGTSTGGALTPGAGGAAQVADVKFITGDEKLKSAGDLLKTGKFGFVFPGESATKVIRRGTLSCGANGQCSFIMMSPDAVTSIE